MAAFGRKPRGTAGDSLLKKVRQSLSKGEWKPGLTLLTGEDLYHLDTTLRSLLDSLVAPGEEEYGLTVYGDQKVDWATVVSAARSVGMFAPRRVVVVRDRDVIEGKEPEMIVEYAKRPPSSSYLLVRAPKLDRRRKLDQALARAGTTLEFAVPEGPALVRSVAELATERGLRIDRDAAAFLAEISEGDFYRIDAELSKALCWLGPDDSKRVDSKLLREIASGSGHLGGWEVVDAVMARDRAAAFASVRQLIGEGQEPLRIIGGLAFQTRKMLQSRGGRYSLPELLCFPSALLEADRTLKSRAVSPVAVLERLVDRLTGGRVPVDNR